MLKRLDKYDNVNKHFEDFVLIGSGGYGEVYSATFKKTGKRMAIKILTVFDATKKEVNQIRFKNECNVLKTINSKNVVRMIGYYVSENESYYAMELIKGINLRSLISKYKKIPVEEAVRIAREICEGLADIHLANVIHRDLKPSNILIESETNTVKLIDFGISLSDDSLRVTADNKLLVRFNILLPKFLQEVKQHQFKVIFMLLEWFFMKCWQVILYIKELMLKQCYYYKLMEKYHH